MNTHVPLKERLQKINALDIRTELKPLLLGELKPLGLEEYFQNPLSFYAQGASDNQADWPDFQSRSLLPLWESDSSIYALDLKTKECLFWYLECPESYDKFKSIDQAIFNVIDLHIWEFGYLKDGVEDVITFSKIINLPNFENLLKLLQTPENTTKQMVISFAETL